jgi:hypothetical protein
VVGGSLLRQTSADERSHKEAGLCDGSRRWNGGPAAWWRGCYIVDYCEPFSSPWH